MFHLLLWLLSECLLMANREIVTDFLHVVLSVYVMVFFTPAYTTLYALQFDLQLSLFQLSAKFLQSWKTELYQLLTLTMKAL